MKTLHELIEKYAAEAGLVWGDTKLPFYTTSVGAHILNLYNKGVYGDYHSGFYSSGGKPFDLRIHLFGVGVPGYGRSTFIDLFLNSKRGFLSGTPISHQSHDRLTGKGLTGGWDSDGNKIEGEAERLGDGIMGLEEFQAFSKVSQQAHSKGIEQTLLRLLDSGEVTYKVGSYPILHYWSNMTMWASTQNAFGEEATKSGFARRIYPISMNPSLEEQKQFYTAYDENIGKPTDWDLIERIRRKISTMIGDFEIQRIWLGKNYREHRKFLCGQNHILAQKLDKLAIANTYVRKYKKGETLHVTLDKKIKEMLGNYLGWRSQLFYDMEEISVLRLMRKKRKWKLTPLKKKLTTIGMTYKEATKLLNNMAHAGLISFTKKKVKGKCKKPVTFVYIKMNEGKVIGILRSTAENNFKI